MVVSGMMLVIVSMFNLEERNWRKEMDNEVVKIRTKKGRIITLSIIKRTDKHILGDDKFGKPTIVAVKDIDEMLPIWGG